MKTDAMEVMSTAENDKKGGLSQRKQRIAMLLADPDGRCTVAELCQQENISLTTLCKYLDDQDLVGYVRQLIDKYSESALAAVWGALVEKCKAGDMRAIKLYFELKGKFGGGDWLDEAGVVITGGDELE